MCYYYSIDILTKQNNYRSCFGDIPISPWAKVAILLTMEVIWWRFVTVTQSFVTIVGHAKMLFTARHRRIFDCLHACPYLLKWPPATRCRSCGVQLQLLITFLVTFHKKWEILTCFRCNIQYLFAHKVQSSKSCIQKISAANIVWQ